MQDALIAHLTAVVKDEFGELYRQSPVVQLTCIDWAEGAVRSAMRALAHAAIQAWGDALQQLALELGALCPSCGRTRKCKRRLGHRMQLSLLGMSFELPKLYLECGHCSAPGVSITKLLTGLRSGDTTAELKLSAAYLSAEHTYGKAGRDLGVHYGEELERTLVRRLALEVEKEAMVFAEQTRRKALKPLSVESRTEGVERLMFQGDGGSVRTGTLKPCEPGDPGYGKRSPKLGRPKRKRVVQGRELITLDVREPGETTASALDIVVPFQAREGERQRRMLALAMRKNLGSDTQVIGLGDMGSSLPAAFKEAFVGYDAFYSADWKHVCDYVRGAAAVLGGGVDNGSWAKEMRDAIWKRDMQRRDELLKKARRHRMRRLPEYLDKCPVKALATYLTNNWMNMQAARLKELGVDYVSARAESQVRDRTKSRFSVPGAWRAENLEPKATLRSVIAEGRWDAFRRHYLDETGARHEQAVRERLQQAVEQGRLRADCLEKPPESLDKAA
jgi:hypothetical protein